MNEKDTQELSRLSKMYPLFQFEHRKEDMYIAKYSESSSYHFTIENGRVDCEAEHTITKEHMRKSIAVQLMERFPNLYISAYLNKNGIDITAWVKRNERDAEGIGTISITSPTFHSYLKHWNEEAEKAIQSNWFLCSGCQEAFPKSEYDYFYFAGKYCHKCAEKNPSHKNQALNERYN